MMLQSPSTWMVLLGAAANTLACVIPTTPLSNNITEGFRIFVQNSSLPLVHNRVLNFRPNGLDKHLVLRPAGEDTGDLIYLENGFLRFEGRHAVIDLEYNPADDTTKMFMTDRTYPSAVFQPIYVCDQDTDELRIALRLVSRLLDPPVNGGQIGIQTAGDTYEFRYSPPNNPLLDARFFSVTMVIFRNGSSPPTPTTTTANPAATPTAVGNYQFVSCWAEPAGGRTLQTVFTADDMTNAKCAGLCAGAQYFGTQYSVECWCGATLAAGSASAPGTECANTCGGNRAEICGGGRRLSLYRLSSGSSSSLTTTVRTTSSTTTSSTTSSKTTTSASASTTTTPLTTTRSTTTSLTTTSLTTSSRTTTASTTPSASSTTRSSSTTTRTTTSATPSTSGTAVGKYSYVSCWAEPASGARTLPSAYLNTADMTLEKCADFCSFYPYFGTQWGRECWCGDQLTAGSAAAPASDCNTRCIGDATEVCGGSRRLSLYHVEGWTGPPTPSSVAGYNWLGCITDSPRRTLNSASLSSSTMTLERCATFCAGYTYFGTEWSIECWCGNTLTTGSTQVGISQCSANCGGNALQKCGNADRLSVYRVGP